MGATLPFTMNTCLWLAEGTGLMPSILQVNGLRPGRTYAFRLQIHPVITPPWSAPPEPQESSPPMTCSTPATAPSPPHAPTVSARDRRVLTVRLLPAAYPMLLKHFSWPDNNIESEGAVEANAAEYLFEGPRLCDVQFKWRPPDEPGGPAIIAYRFQMSPPPDVVDELKEEEVGPCIQQWLLPHSVKTRHQ